MSDVNHKPYEGEVFTDPQLAKVWVSAWCSATASPGCPNPRESAYWADACVKQYRERFNLQPNA